MHKRLDKPFTQEKNSTSNWQACHVTETTALWSNLGAPFKGFNQHSRTHSLFARWDATKEWPFSLFYLRGELGFREAGQPGCRCWVQLSCIETGMVTILVCECVCFVTNSREGMSLIPKETDPTLPNKANKSNTPTSRHTYLKRKREKSGTERPSWQEGTSSVYSKTDRTNVGCLVVIKHCA